MNEKLRPVHLVYVVIGLVVGLYLVGRAQDTKEPVAPGRMYAVVQPNTPSAEMMDVYELKPGTEWRLADEVPLMPQLRTSLRTIDRDVASIVKLPAGTILTIVEAVPRDATPRGHWYRVATANGLSGFVNPDALAGQTFDMEQIGGPPQLETPEIPEPITVSLPDEEVWITLGSEDYHREDCRLLGRNSWSMTKEDAVKVGCAPCPQCYAEDL